MCPHLFSAGKCRCLKAADKSGILKKNAGRIHSQTDNHHLNLWWMSCQTHDVMSDSNRQHLQYRHVLFFYLQLVWLGSSIMLQIALQSSVFFMPLVVVIEILSLARQGACQETFDYNKHIRKDLHQALFQSRESFIHSSQPEQNNNQKCIIHALYLLWPLNTLFNIVEAPLKKIVELWSLCCIWWCSDGPLNSQEYKSFEIYAVSISRHMTVTE